MPDEPAHPEQETEGYQPPAVSEIDTRHGPGLTAAGAAVNGSPPPPP